ncbi:MAG: hypothetical protein F6K00_11495 [Leptolyngbya sp. SIOISBB]|nr:hypothetical protein [Leptolyngbya sp. SIOISBB]
MNKFNSTRLRSRIDPDEGWLVQVYGSDRRLLCVLESSHGWIFLLGCSVGALLAVFWFNIARYSPPVVPTTPSSTPSELRVD